MAKFDKIIWENRAILRKTQTQINSAFDAINNLSVLDLWLQKQNVDLEFKKIPNGLYDDSEKKIFVNSNAKPETQVHILLHECGHYRWTLKNSRLKQHSDDCRKNSHAYIVNLVSEEVEAWELGRTLALKLGIVLDHRFETFRVQCLFSYIKWATVVKNSPNEK